MIRVDAALEIIGESSLQRRVLELPHGERVEPEVILAVGAVPVLLLAILEIGLAVIPKADLVDVPHGTAAGSTLDSLDEIIVGGHALGQMIQHVFWILCETRGIGLHARVLA